MQTLSFDIKNTGHFYKKLLEEVALFKQDPISSRQAINCAMNAWHLTDWCYHEFGLSTQFKKLSDYYTDLKLQCPSLQIMHDIANGTKHFNLTSHQPKVKDSKLHEGAFSQEFSREFDISCLELEMKDGSVLYFEDVLENVVAFWTTYLRNNFGITG